jgi:hypothetical protein
MRKFLGPIAAAIAIAGSVVGIATAPASFWRSLYPAPVIALLTAALLGSWIYIWLEQRKPSEADQLRLDRLLSALPREAIRRIASEDYMAAWRERSIYPVTKYVHELEGPEEHFDSKAMESCRLRLYTAADKFTWAEAKKGYAHELARGFRNTGWSDGELENDQGKLAKAEERGGAIRSAAAEFLAAHDALLASARRRGLNLDAISSEAPYPAWEDDDRMSSDEDPVRAQWHP